MSRPGRPRLATSKTSESSGIRASPKAEAISRVIVRSTARRLPSTARAQAKTTSSESTTVKTMARATLKAPSASRPAAETAAQAATAA